MRFWGFRVLGFLGFEKFWGLVVLRRTTDTVLLDCHFVCGASGVILEA